MTESFALESIEATVQPLRCRARMEGLSSPTGHRRRAGRRSSKPTPSSGSSREAILESEHQNTAVTRKRNLTETIVASQVVQNRQRYDIQEAGQASLKRLGECDDVAGAKLFDAPHGCPEVGFGIAKRSVITPHACPQTILGGKKGGCVSVHPRDRKSVV